MDHEAQNLGDRINDQNICGRLHANRAAFTAHWICCLGQIWKVLRCYAKMNKNINK